MKKRILAMLLILSTLSTILNFNIVVNAVSINDSSIFVKQPSDGDGTCVFTSCLNMFRRRAIIDGRTDWGDITHSNYKNTITTDGTSVRWTITDVKGMNASMTYIGSKSTEEKKNYFISMLSQHPEGIVIYCGSNPMHTVLLTDYTSGTFYCVETLNSYPAGRIPLTSTYIGRNLSQDSAVAKISQIWYITNKSGSGGGGGTGCSHSYKQYSESAHPHKVYMKCSSCGDWYYTGGTTTVSGCSQCVHTHSYVQNYEAAHPHKVYMKCSSCGDWYYTGATTIISSCSQCVESLNPDDYPIPTRTLSVTSPYMSGNDVRWVQAILLKLGYSITVDGVYGSGTRDTVKQFQSANGLTADGICGELTRNALKTKWENLKNPEFGLYFNANGGSVYPTSKFIRYGSPYGDLPTPTRTGYTFTGWYADEFGGYQVTSSTTVTVNKEHTLYAHWTPHTYTVSYNANGGSGAPSAQTKTHDVNLTISSTVPTRAGYAFTGWNTAANGSGTAYAAGSIYTSNASVTLYAQWKVNIFDLTYDANGGDGDFGTLTDVSTVTVTSQIPTRTGYTFVGWANTAGSNVATYLPGDTITLTEDTTLYAQWKAYEVVRTASAVLPVDYNGQVWYIKVSPNSSAKYVFYSSGAEDTVVYLYDSDMNQLTVKDDGGEGYNFRLEYDLTLGETYYLGIKYNNSGVRGSIQFYAGPLLTIKYDANGGNGAPADHNKDPYQDVNLSTEIPTKTDCTFLGWAKSSSDTTAKYQPGELYTSDFDITLYAVWQINPNELTVNTAYDITVSYGGEIRYYTYTPAVSGKYVIYSTSCNNTFVRLYDVNYESIDSDFYSKANNNNFRLECDLVAGTTYRFGVSFSNNLITGDISFVFGNTYKVTYDFNGGTDGPANQIKDYGSDLTLTYQWPTRSDYTFYGWTETIGDTSKIYHPGDLYEIDRDITLYAIWKTNEGLESIDIIHPPVNTSCYIGDAFDTSGLMLKLTYEDGTTENVTCGYTAIGFASDSAGTRTITVSYGGFTDTYTLTVQTPYVTLSEEDLVIERFGTLTLTAVTTPSDKRVSWSSSNTNIVSINSSGELTAKAIGTAVVTARFTYNGIVYSNMCSVTVTEPTVKSISVYSRPDKTKYEIGEPLDTTGLKLKVTYDNGRFVYITSGFTTSGFDSTSEGTYTVDVTYGGKTASFTVTVNPLKLKDVEITTLPVKTQYYKGDSLDTTGLELTLTYSNGTTEIITSGFTTKGFSSTTAGTKTVTVTYEGLTDRFTVKVSTPSVTLSDTKLSIVELGTATLVATTEPAGQAVTWVSSKTGVATVSDGVVTAIASGTATIMAEFVYNGATYRKTCSVTVTKPTLESISVYTNPTKTVYVIGEKLDTSGLVLELRYNNSKIEYVSGAFSTTGFSSTSTGIKTVKVTYNGKTTTFNVIVNASRLADVQITTNPAKSTYYIGDSLDMSGIVISLAYENGTTETITSGFTTSGFSSISEGIKTVTVSYGGFTDTFTVTVNTPTITLSDSSLVLEELGTATITATTTPNGQSVIWTSSDTSIASVENGTVTAKVAGSVAITAEFTYNGIVYSDTCLVTVAEPEPECPHDNSVSHIVTAPTCTTEGTQITYCAVCGEVISEESIPTSEHDWSEWVQISAPTATKDGEQLRYCKICKTSETETIPATGEEEPEEPVDPNAPKVVSLNNYTISLDKITNIKEIRFAIGHYTKGADIKVAEKNVTLDASTVKKYTTDSVMTYDLPWMGEYTFWVRYNDGSQYFIYTNVDDITPYVESYGVKLTVKDYAENYKDMWLAEGTFNTYNEIKASTAFKYQASANKLDLYAKTTHDFSYTMTNPGPYTVLIRYNDGSVDVIHTTLTVDVPEFSANGLQVTVTNIPDIKIIRTAYGHYTSVGDIKKASGVRNFSNKTDINNADEYMIQYRDAGEVTMIVEYNNGYKHFYYLNIEPKTATMIQSKNTVMFDDLDGFVMIRYAKGTYKTSSQIKAAAGSKVVKPADLLGGYAIISELEKGTYTFCVQFDDESYDYYTVTVE